MRQWWSQALVSWLVAVSVWQTAVVKRSLPRTGGTVQFLSSEETAPEGRTTISKSLRVKRGQGSERKSLSGSQVYSPEPEIVCGFASWQYSESPECSPQGPQARPAQAAKRDLEASPGSQGTLTDLVTLLASPGEPDGPP